VCNGYQVNEKKLRKLIEIFSESGVEEMEYHESFWRGIRVRLGKRQPGLEGSDAVRLQSSAQQATTPVPTPEADDVEKTAVEKDVTEDLHIVRSPMVGTFYRASSPEAESFANSGEHVSEGQTLCIIEAMKIMNEIEADANGEIVEILVSNGDPVEYNQPLLTMRT